MKIRSTRPHLVLWADEDGLTYARGRELPCAVERYLVGPPLEL